MTIEVVTFGCRLNAYESEAIKARAREAQLRDVVVVNTCAVTAEAVRQSRQAIRRLRRENPGRPILVTGCAAQIEPQTYAAMAEVDAVLGNAEKLIAGSYADFGIGGAERIKVNDIMSVRQTAPQMVDHFEGHTRAFLQVQNGCDHRCTFCIIPFGRGPSRSVPMAPSSIQALTARIRAPSPAGRKCVATFVWRAVSITNRDSLTRLAIGLCIRTCRPFFIAAMATVA